MVVGGMFGGRSRFRIKESTTKDCMLMIFMGYCKLITYYVEGMTLVNK